MSRPPEDVASKILAATGDLDQFLRGLGGVAPSQPIPGMPARVDANPKNVEKGLAQLVLTLIDLLRQLMERQAVRRMEGGSLSEEEIERLGQTFMMLDERMRELKQAFGLTDTELKIDLGRVDPDAM